MNTSSRNDDSLPLNCFFAAIPRTLTLTGTAVRPLAAFRWWVAYLSNAWKTPPSAQRGGECQYLACAVNDCLSAAGLKVKPGQLELFPHKRSFNSDALSMSGPGAPKLLTTNFLYDEPGGGEFLSRGRFASKKYTSSDETYIEIAIEADSQIMKR